ncbi:hypothetical protein U9M73_13200 [Paenibacillus phoenicis]|uniref:Uncharacterized protein n=1 Tax=Paenibacillus phoenicis TaxID=554117 RepID=A0ABU5PMB0_9BACL|nr:hypothetical protein [Paenibacillus phoenicis]MEA3570942.1 hypothetical protein [Paenibacillus phoenicis]
MITARGLIGGDTGVTTRRITPQPAKLPKQIVTVRRRVTTSPSGDMFATVTFEAVDGNGAVIRAESLRTRQPVTLSAIIPRQQDFIDALAAEGYAVRV